MTHKIFSVRRLVQSLVLLVLAATSGNYAFAQGITPIDNNAGGTHLFFAVKNVVVTNSASAPQISFDLYMSASAAYVAYVTANGSDYGMNNVDVAYDIDFGTGTVNGSPVTTALTTATPQAAPTITSPMIATASATSGFTGVSQAPYDTRFVIKPGRTAASSPITTTPTKILSMTVSFPAGTVIGRADSNTSTIRMRANGVSTYTTGANSSKWGDFLGNAQLPVGPSSSFVQPLPVKLFGFDAKKISETRAQLNWQTSMEQGTDYFEVERSVDGRYFGTSVRRMQAAGNSTTTLDYQTYDNEPVRGMNYYRLKMVDAAGKFTYSEVRAVNFGVVRSYNLSPNPAKDYVNVTGMDAGATVMVMTGAGQVVSEIKATSATEKINLNMVPGIYYIQIVQDGNIVYNQKFVKQ